MHHTFKVFLTVEIQHTFDEASVSICSEDGNFEPSDEALQLLASELTEKLTDKYAILNIEASSDSLMLLASESENRAE